MAAIRMGSDHWLQSDVCRGALSIGCFGWYVYRMAVSLTARRLVKTWF